MPDPTHDPVSLLREDLLYLRQAVDEIRERMHDRVTRAEHNDLVVKVSSQEKTLLWHSHVGKTIASFLTLAWGGLVALFANR